MFQEPDRAAWWAWPHSTAPGQGHSGWLGLHREKPRQADRHCAFFRPAEAPNARPQQRAVWRTLFGEHRYRHKEGDQVEINWNGWCHCFFFQQNYTSMCRRSKGNRQLQGKDWYKRFSMSLMTWSAQGDSGGPLLSRELAASPFMLVGVVSGGTDRWQIRTQYSGQVICIDQWQVRHRGTEPLLQGLQLPPVDHWQHEVETDIHVTIFYESRSKILADSFSCNLTCL